MVTAKQVINSTKPVIAKVPKGKTQLGSAGYDNPREDIEKVKKIREGTVAKTPVNATDIANKAYVDSVSGGAPEGTAVLSTGEVGGTKFLREDGDGTSSWQPAAAAHTESSTDSLTNKTIDSFTNQVEADEIHIQIRNESGSTMTKGQLIYISGYNSGLDRPLVTLADASSTSTMPMLAMINDGDIANNADGHATVSGRVFDIDTSAFSIGDAVYVSTTAGGLSTRPSGTTDQVQRIGIILRSHASNGVIQIIGAGRTNDIPNDIDHAADLQNVGTNTHAQIDTSITATGLNTTHRSSDGSDHSLSHAESHNIASHSDTTATGAELETLTDGSETTLHSHAGAIDADFIIDAINQNRLNILINSVASSSNLNTFDDGVADIYSRAQGKDNTIDTGNTTAFFTPNKYGNIASLQEAHGFNITATGAATTKSGVEIHTNFALTLTQVTKDSDSTATKCQLMNATTHVDIAEADFVGDIATFNETLDDDTDYYITADEEGASYTRAQQSSPSFPYNKTNINYINAVLDGDAGTEVTNFMHNIVSVTTYAGTPADKFVQTNALSITANPVAVQLFQTSVVAGSGSVDFDFKIGSEAFQTGKAYGAKIINSDTGNTITIKHHLKGTGSGNTAEASDYVLFLYY